MLTGFRWASDCVGVQSDPRLCFKHPGEFVCHRSQDDKLDNYTIAIKLNIFHLIKPLRFLETVRNETFEKFPKIYFGRKKQKYLQFDKEKTWNLRLIYRLQTPYKNYPLILQNSMKTAWWPRVSKTFTIRPH